VHFAPQVFDRVIVDQDAMRFQKLIQPVTCAENEEALVTWAITPARMNRAG
jgi:hypothetical protein